NLVGESGPGVEPMPGKTKGMIHPTGAGNRLALCGGDSQKALEPRRAVAALVAFHFEVEQLQPNGQRYRFPTVSYQCLARRSGESDPPAGRNPLLDGFAILLEANAHAVRQIRGCKRRGRALWIGGSKIHSRLRVRDDLVCDKLPVSPTSRKRLVQIDSPARIAFRARHQLISQRPIIGD